MRNIINGIRESEMYEIQYVHTTKEKPDAILIRIFEGQ